MGVVNRAGLLGTGEDAKDTFYTGPNGTKIVSFG